MGRHGQLFSLQEAADMLNMKLLSLKSLKSTGVIPVVLLSGKTEHVAEETMRLLLACPYRWNSKPGKAWLSKQRPADMVVYQGEDLGVE